MILLVILLINQFEIEGDGRGLGEGGWAKQTVIEVRGGVIYRICCDVSISVMVLLLWWRFSFLEGGSGLELDGGWGWGGGRVSIFNLNAVILWYCPGVWPCWWNDRVVIESGKKYLKVQCIQSNCLAPWYI